MGQGTVLETIQEFKKALEDVNIRVDQLILFGSHASGTAREDSDIDLVVISSSFADKSYWERINILTDAIYGFSGRPGLFDLQWRRCSGLAFARRGSA